MGGIAIRVLSGTFLEINKSPGWNKGPITRVCVGRNFSSNWGDMCNLAFIATTILNFGGNEC